MCTRSYCAQARNRPLSTSSSSGTSHWCWCSTTSAGLVSKRWASATKHASSPASRLLSPLTTTFNRRPSPAEKLWGSSKVQRQCGCSRINVLQCVTPSTKGPPRAFDRVDAWWFSDICQDPVWARLRKTSASQGGEAITGAASAALLPSPARGWGGGGGSASWPGGGGGGGRRPGEAATVTPESPAGGWGDDASPDDPAPGSRCSPPRTVARIPSFMNSSQMGAQASWPTSGDTFSQVNHSPGRKCS